MNPPAPFCGMPKTRSLFSALAVCLVSLAFLTTAHAQAPNISGLIPSATTAGTPSFTLTVNGSGFVGPLLLLPGSTVNWNTSSLATEFVSSTQLRATVSANLVSTSGTASVTVVNPSGDRSNAVAFVINPPPTITTASPLPGGTVGVAYSQTFSASGGTPPYSWSLASGSPPPGLTLAPGGVFSGTPTVAGTFSFTVRVTDNSQGSANKNFSLTINPATAALAITTASPLPDGTVNAAYSQTFSATGGTPPYSWSLAVGSPPPGLSLAPGGTLSGTPTAAGTFSFTVRVTDSGQDMARNNFSLTISPAGLMITTTSPLPGGTVGTAYSQALSATGGTRPYRWTRATGSLPPGLTLDLSGDLSGTPTTAGTFSFAVQVADSATANASKDFSLLINPAGLVITTGSPLPGGTLGTVYSQTFSATGGTPPYRWSLISGSLPTGLALDPGGVLSGTPTNTGTFSFTIQVTSSTQVNANKNFSLTSSPDGLVIITGSPLPGGTLGTAYSQRLSASGGAPPYTWVIISGAAPPGMVLDPGGVLSGTPTATGTSVFTIQVTDSSRAQASKPLAMSVASAPPPQVIFSGLPDAVTPAQQIKVELRLARGYPQPIEGEIVLAFTPDAVMVGNDPAVQFSTGVRPVSFTIPANTTEALFPTSELGLQTGTVAGTITLSVRMRSGGTDITPSPAPSQSARLKRLPPGITNLRVVRTPTGFDVIVTGFSTPREISRAVFQFTAVAGSNLQTTDVTVDLASTFQSWYQNAASAQFGSQFTLTQPFTVQGDPASLSAVSVTLTNAEGTAEPASANF